MYFRSWKRLRITFPRQGCSARFSCASPNLLETGRNVSYSSDYSATWSVIRSSPFSFSLFEISGTRQSIFGPQYRWYITEGKRRERESETCDEDRGGKGNYVFRESTELPSTEELWIDLRIAEMQARRGPFRSRLHFPLARTTGRKGKGDKERKKLSRDKGGSTGGEINGAMWTKLNES